MGGLLHDTGMTRPAQAGMAEALTGLGVPYEAAHAAANGPAATRICLSGQIASGKDTVADRIRSELPPPVEVGKFAAALRAEADILLRAAEAGDPAAGCKQIGLSGRDAERASAAAIRCVAGDGERRSGPLLQLLGGDIRRGQDALYWVRRFAEWVAPRLAAGTTVLVTDARFENEMALLRRLGFTLVRLDCPIDIRRARLVERDGAAAGARDLNHPTETGLDGFRGFDAVVDSSTSLEETMAAVRAAIQAGPKT